MFDVLIFFSYKMKNNRLRSRIDNLWLEKNRFELGQCLKSCSFCSTDWYFVLFRRLFIRLYVLYIRNIHVNVSYFYCKWFPFENHLNLIWLKICTYCSHRICKFVCFIFFIVFYSLVLQKLWCFWIKNIKLLFCVYVIIHFLRFFCMFGE